jgi:hypothetical protein
MITRRGFLSKVLGVCASAVAASALPAVAAAKKIQTWVIPGRWIMEKPRILRVSYTWQIHEAVTGKITYYVPRLPANEDQSPKLSE